jgi:hypothetical protein
MHRCLLLIKQILSIYLLLTATAPYNICKRIERAMRMVGVPTTAARTRYARLVGCVRAMRGSAQRWHAAWALYNILKDWLSCPGDEPASDNFQSTIAVVEEELASLCYENEEN